MRPISVMNNEGFKELMEEADPKYVLPSIKTVKNSLLPKLYKENKSELMKDLESVKFACMTTDGWTSMATDKYNAFTIHYVDWSVSKPELKSKVLECAPYEERSTSIELEKELRRVINEHNLESKLVLEIADNASDIQKALELLGFPRIGCAAHKINLVAKLIFQLQRIKDLKEKLTRIVKTTKVSPNAKKALQSCLERVGLSKKKIKALVSYVKTRWNTFYLMIDRILEFKDAIILYLATYNVDNEDRDLIDDGDWDLIKELSVLLRPLWLATKELSAEKNTTLSKVLPMVSVMLDSYAANYENESQIAKEARRLIFEGLKDKFSGMDCNQTYTSATIFDPRFKNLVFATKTKAQNAVNQAKADAVSIGHKNSPEPDAEMNKSENTSIKVI